MKTFIITLILLTLALTACASTQPADIQGTAVALAVTEINLTQSALPTAIPTQTRIIEPTPSPIPTLSLPIILTPDAALIEQWRKYQTELAKILFTYDPYHPEGYDPEAYKDAICEWDILEKSGQEVYVWADCLSADGLSLKANPAMIYIELDQTIKQAVVPTSTFDREGIRIYDLHLFSIATQKTLCLHYFYGIVPQCKEHISTYYPAYSSLPREQILVSHLKYRQHHPEEPPLVVLSATTKP